jgi:hypothetical protein
LETLYPYRVHGRLFATVAGRNITCSATVVTSVALNLILTAGHCVSLGGAGTLGSNVAFVPAYRDNVRPFGTWPASAIGVPAGWLTERDYTFDVAAVNLAPNSGGPIQAQLGSRGVSFNRPMRRLDGQLVSLLGYPGTPQPGYNGERLVQCNASILDVLPLSLDGTYAVGPCAMKEGSSGGGYVSDGAFVTAVNSHSACGPSPACTNHVGTYLGSAAFELYAAASGGVSAELRKQMRKCRKKAKKLKNRGKRLRKQQRCLSRIQTFAPTG